MSEGKEEGENSKEDQKFGGFATMEEFTKVKLIFKTIPCFQICSN